MGRRKSHGDEAIMIFVVKSGKIMKYTANI